MNNEENEEECFMQKTMKSKPYVVEKIDKAFLDKEKRTNKLFKEKVNAFDMEKTLKDIETAVEKLK